MPEPEGERRFSDRGMAVSWILGLRDIVLRCTEQRARAERQRDSAKAMREAAHAMRDRVRIHWPRGR